MYLAHPIPNILFSCYQPQYHKPYKRFWFPCLSSMFSSLTRGGLFCVIHFRQFWMQDPTLVDSLTRALGGSSRQHRYLYRYRRCYGFVFRRSPDFFQGLFSQTAKVAFITSIEQSLAQAAPWCKSLVLWKKIYIHILYIITDFGNHSPHGELHQCYNQTERHNMWRHWYRTSKQTRNGREGLGPRECRVAHGAWIHRWTSVNTFGALFLLIFS